MLPARHRLGGLVVAGRDAAPLLEPVEAPFHYVAPLVELLVEAWRASAPAAAPEPVADLVGPLGDGMADAATPEPGSYRAGAVALVAQHVSRPHPGPPRPGAGHPDRFHHGGELRAVVGVPARESEGERTPESVTGQVNPAGQATPRASEAWAAASPAASTRACAARSIRSKAPSRAHRRNRVCSVYHGPYRSGTSGQAVPVRNLHTIPLSTLRSSHRFHPRKDAGSSGRTNSSSSSDSSWRRITRP